MNRHEENKAIKEQLNNMSKSELKMIADECGFVDDDLRLLINAFCNKKSNQYIAQDLNICVDSVAKRKRKIIDRIYRYKQTFNRKEPT